MINQDLIARKQGCLQMQFFRNHLRPQCRIFVTGMILLWSAVVVGQVADDSQPAPPEAEAVIGVATDPAAVEPVLPEAHHVGFTPRMLQPFHA